MPAHILPTHRRAIHHVRTVLNCTTRISKRNIDLIRGFNGN
jgi:hypothetical protein